MCFEVPMPLFGVCRIKAALCLRPAMEQTVGGRALGLRVLLRLLAGFPQIDKVAHGGSRWYGNTLKHRSGTLLCSTNCDRHAA
jgi:hypothetical protein